MDGSDVEYASVSRMQRSHSSGRLVVAALKGRSHLKRLFETDALKLRFPKNNITYALEGILVNTAGGLAGGDSLSLNIHVEKGADLTITSQACERVYKSLEEEAVVDLRLRADADSNLIWAPQETIIYNNARLTRTIDVTLSPSSTFLAIEAIIWGRELMGEQVRNGALRDSWRIKVGDQLVHAENTRLEGDIHMQMQNGVVAKGGRATATLLMVGANCEKHLHACRSICASANGVVGGASHWHVGPYAKLLIRLVGDTSYDLRKCVVQLVMQLSSNGIPPRVWSL
ncbi:urease accessory protein UreD [Hirschia litorea]|uniref:Urease accessory protein UreD n=1 Tax=Hirschia litorea TaxID=1199156 RepID=A0ABW2IPR8_9PROT